MNTKQIMTDCFIHDKGMNSFRIDGNTHKVMTERNNWEEQDEKQSNNCTVKPISIHLIICMISCRDIDNCVDI